MTYSHINTLRNQHIKMNLPNITIADRLSVVEGVEAVIDLNKRDLEKYQEVITRSGIMNNAAIRYNLVRFDNELYYLYDLNYDIDNYYHRQHNDIAADLLEIAGIIPCYIIK